MVRAKFFCSKNEKYDGVDGKIHNVELKSVYEGSAENKEFWKWTPNGQLNLGTINPSAAEYFEVGKEYYLDLTKAGE